MPQSILITGASSGFGRLIAQTLLEEGCTVHATMRDPEGRNAPVASALEAFAQPVEGTLHVHELDVTDDASVLRARDVVLRETGVPDVVVNNAGTGAGGHVEAFTIEQFRALFDVNVFGVQRVNRAFLPAMREAGRGLLLHISSVMGRVVIPFGGPYTSTKWALEGLAESYAYELRGTGVDVAIVEPGGFMTGLAERVLVVGDPDRVAEYGELASLPDTLWGGFMEKLQGEGAPDPQDVADAVLHLVRTPAGARPLRTVVDPLMGGDPPAKLNAESSAAQAVLLAEFGLEQP